jgi:F420-non-reducing hydrogenase small subunit
VLLRRKSRLVVGFGSCAQLGGIPGLANLTSREAILREVYGDEAPREQFRDDGHSLSLPALFESVFALGRVIPVEYYVPGCPPSAPIIAGAFQTLLGSELPPEGSVLAPDRTMCDECPRHDTHPAELVLERYRRVTEAVFDPNTCLMAQGLPCLGPATRAGCGSRCIRGNMPCTGCFGPTSKVRDYGAKALCSIASVVAGSEEERIDQALEGLADPAGTFYRYSLPSSFIERKWREASEARQE